MMVGLIDRYILREFWPFFAISYGVATLILFLDKLLWLTSLVIHSHLEWTTLARFFGFMLPTVTGFTLPVAFLIGCTLAFNRLSTDSEFVVMKASGISFYRLLLPLFGVAVSMYVLSSAVFMYVSPWGFQGLQYLFAEVARSRAQYHLQPGKFHDAFEGLVIYVDHTFPEERRLEGVFIADERSQPGQVITAQEGELLTQEDTLQVVLRLKQGRLHRYEPQRQRYHLLRFDRYDVRLNLDTHLARRVNRTTRPRELFPSQLRAEIVRHELAGEAEEARHLIFFQHKLYSLPFACILFAGLGPSLGVVRTRSGRSGGYVFGIGAIFLYYLFLTASNALGQETGAPPLFAAWLPNLALAALMLGLLRRTARDATQFDFLGLIDGCYRYIRTRVWAESPRRS
jgi:lipopolysaccharide export system permease protein